jgi:hypothetical protein
MAFDQRHRFLISKVGGGLGGAVPAADASQPVAAVAHQLRRLKTPAAPAPRPSLQIVEAFGIDEVVVEKKLM